MAQSHQGALLAETQLPSPYSSSYWWCKNCTLKSRRRTKCLYHSARQEFLSPCIQILCYVVHFSGFFFLMPVCIFGRTWDTYWSLVARRFNWFPNSELSLLSWSNIYLVMFVISYWLLFCEVYFLLILAHILGLGMHNEKLRSVQKYRSMNRWYFKNLL